ncbi:MAG TPA: FAD-dependent oxidoreductase [Vicinamibacteria bacterium]
MQRRAEVVVVGGGLAGLAASAYLARAGGHVVLVEKAAAIGGRARTQSDGGFQFNLGAHALYRAGAGMAVLRELGVPVAGGRPTGEGGYAVHGGAMHTLPAGFVSLLTTGLLRPSEKMEAARLFAALGRTDADHLQDVPLAAWLARIHSPTVRQLMEATARVATYTNDPQRMSAGAALAQMRRALASGVLYLHGGWQTLVDGLRKAAEEAGVRILERRAASAIERDAAVRGVRLDDGETLAAGAVLVTGGPDAAATLAATGGSTLVSQWAEQARPVRAASLDVALRRLPRPHATFALGIDEPVYVSVHSAAARLAPEGGALVHVMRYGGRAGDAPETVERQLTGLLDALQPGWRDGVVRQRFLPELVVSHALPEAARGGTRGRPGPRVPDVPGLYVAGDWVGPEGMLADASLASARAAAAAILAGAARATSAA